jgi:FAD binding domain
VLSKVLGPRALGTLRAAWFADAARLVDEVLAETEFDAVTRLAEAFPLRIFPDAVGIPQQERENLLPYGDHLFNAFGPHNDLTGRGEPRAAGLSAWVNAQCAREVLAPGGLGARIWAAADHGDITCEQAPLVVRSLLSAGAAHRVDADIIAGCDGALHSMRSAAISRFYLQVSPGEDLTGWTNDRIWDELAARLGHGRDGWSLRAGPITDKSVLPMRSFVATPMRYGRLFLAGDAAHIVPPTGAKGLNLAVADVALLSRAITAWPRDKNEEPAAAYSANALRRVWRCTHFSWWMTTTLHRHGDDFDAQLQLSQLRRVVTSRAAATELAENYAGIPMGYAAGIIPGRRTGRGPGAVTAGEPVLFNETPVAASAAAA